ncbi:hypothetical protein JXB41_03175 [Candidatus Woesearchaeota archaeon]|nr:hypothetical protein [Candidatus Woesearchaeota archaeon]
MIIKKLNKKVDIKALPSLYLLFLIITIVYSFLQEKVIIIIQNIKLLYLILFFIGCYISAFASIITSSKRPIKINFIKSIFNEAEEEISFEKNRFSIPELISLLILLATAFIVIIDILNQWLLLTFIGVLGLSFTFLKNNNWKTIGKSIIRYLLEIPKLYFLFQLINITSNLAVILFIISIASIFYYIIPRGIFLLEIYVAVLFFVLGFNMEVYLLFIIFARVVGSIFILAPYLLFILKNHLRIWQYKDKR